MSDVGFTTTFAVDQTPEEAFADIVFDIYHTEQGTRNE